MAALVAGLAVWQYFEARRQQQTAQEQAQRANAELRRAVETDGRRLAQIAGRYLQEGRPHQAIMVAHEAFAPLKEGLPFQERPYVWQAADVLHRAMAARPILRKTFRGHKYVVSMAAFSPDGKRIVTAGTDGRVFVLDARTLEVERLLIPNPETFRENGLSSDGNVNWATFSPDGEQIATANEDGSVRIFRVRDGKPVLKFQAHPKDVGSLAFSPDGLTMLTASYGGHHQAWLWSTADGTLVRKLIENADCCVSQGVFSPDGHRIAIAESDAVSVWDARNGKKLLRLGGVKLIRGSVAFSPDGARLAAGGYKDKVVRVWDAQSGKEVLTLRGHEADMVGSVAFSPDGRHILTTGCCMFAEALVWDARSGARVASLLGHEAAPQGGLRGVRSAAFSPDGRYIVTAGQDHTVRLWEFTPAAPARLLRYEGNASRFQFSPDGSLIAAMADDAVLVWRPGQDTPVRLPSGNVVDSGFAFTPDGSRLLVLSEHDDDDPVYDAHTLGRVGSVSLHVFDGCGLEAARFPLSFSPDGSRVVGCSGEVVDRKWTGGLVRIWDAHGGDERTVLMRHENVNTATFVGLGDRVMTTGDGLIRFWDAADGSQLVEIQVREESGAIVWAGASPDGTLVASGSVWNRPGVWDTRTGKLVVELEGAQERHLCRPVHARRPVCRDRRRHRHGRALGPAHRKAGASAARCGGAHHLHRHLGLGPPLAHGRRGPNDQDVGYGDGRVAFLGRSLGAQDRRFPDPDGCLHGRRAVASIRLAGPGATCIMGGNPAYSSTSPITEASRAWSTPPMPPCPTVSRRTSGPSWSWTSSGGPIRGARTSRCSPSHQRIEPTLGSGADPLTGKAHSTLRVLKGPGSIYL